MDGRVRVILKNGASFEFDAVEPTVTKDWLGRLGNLDWTRPEDWETDVLYLQRRDVAAVIVIRGPEEPSPESPPSPMG
ncbi:MAG: hypothetical protein WD379_09020 [Dehalococcoidia bacterium]